MADNLKVLSNGAVYDMDKKRIVANPGGGKYAITPETASDFHAKRQERKRERIEAGAMAAVREKMPDDFTGDDGDWIEAVAQQVAYKALDKLDPKQVDAARFLLQEAGLSDKQATPVQEASADAVIAALAAAVGALALGNAFDNSNYHQHSDVVEGEARDADSGQAAGGET